MDTPDGPRQTWNQYYGLLKIVKHVKKEIFFFLFVFLTYGVMALANVGFAEVIQRVEEAFHDVNSPWRLYAPLAMIALTVVRGLSVGLGAYTSSYIVTSMSYRLTMKMYQHIIRLPQSFFDRSSVGELMSKITYNVNCIVAAVRDGVVVVMREGLSFVILLSYLFYLNWSLTLVIGVVLPLVMLLLRIARTRLGILSKRLQKNAGIISRTMLEAFSALQLVRASATEPQEISRFHEYISYDRKQTLKVAIVNAITIPFLQFIISLAFAVIVWIALNGQDNGFDSVGQFLAYLTAAGFIANPLRSLGGIQQAMQAGEVGARDYLHHLSLDYEQDLGEEVLKKEKVKGEMVFKDISFSYPEGQQVFNQLNLRIAPQEKVALVGRSGAGKSTLVNLLLRMYLPQQGHIYLDGTPLNEIKLASLRSNIAYVSQEIFLFNDSLRYNLVYGLTHKVGDKELERILKQAQAWDFVENMPQGLDTLLGDRGLILSGGQKQRISLGRALLKKVPILILDEATSSLDTESEYRIQQVLENLIQRKTVLVIAHRLSTIEKMDRILVLDKGKLKEQGTHKDLLDKRQLYAQLYQRQFSD